MLELESRPSRKTVDGREIPEDAFLETKIRVLPSSAMVEIDNEMVEAGVWHAVKDGAYVHASNEDTDASFIITTDGICHRRECYDLRIDVRGGDLLRTWGTKTWFEGYEDDDR